MGVKLIAQTAPFSIDAPAERRFLVKVIGKMNDGPVALEAFCVNLRRRPSDLRLDPMVSPSLCPTLSIVLKSKYFPQPMVNAAGIGRMMTNCALWKKASLATAKRQPRRGGMAFAGRC